MIVELKMHVTTATAKTMAFEILTASSGPLWPTNADRGNVTTMLEIPVHVSPISAGKGNTMVILVVVVTITAVLKLVVANKISPIIDKQIDDRNLLLK